MPSVNVGPMISRQVTVDLSRESREIQAGAVDRVGNPEVHDEMTVVQRRQNSRRASSEGVATRETSPKRSIEQKLSLQSTKTCFAVLCDESDDDEGALASEHDCAKEQATSSKTQDVPCHVTRASAKKRKSKKRSVSKTALTQQNNCEEREPEMLAQMNALPADSDARGDLDVHGNVVQTANADALRINPGQRSTLCGAVKNQKGIHADVVPAATMAFAAELVALATGVLRQNADIPVAAPAANRRRQFQQQFAVPRNFNKDACGGAKRPVTRQTLTRIKAR
jgi:hypothetical protein